MFKSIKNLFDYNARRIRSYQSIIDQINSLEAKYQKFSDSKLAKQTEVFRKQLKNGKNS